MTETEHLLTCMNEECVEIVKELAELQQRVSKALRFSLEEVQSGQTFNNGDTPGTFTNADRIMAEYYDLQTIVEMLQEMGRLPKHSLMHQLGARETKRSKLAHWIRHAEKNGAMA